MHWVTRSPLPGSSIRKFWLFIGFLIPFKISFNQSFLTSTGNMATFEKLLDSGMQWDTSDNDYTKAGIEFFN